MKAKDILLTIAGIISVLLIVYFTIIDPFAASVSDKGLLKTIAEIVIVVLAFLGVVGVNNDDRIQQPYSTIAVIIIFLIVGYLGRRFF